MNVYQSRLAKAAAAAAMLLRPLLPAAASAAALLPFLLGPATVAVAAPPVQPAKPDATEAPSQVNPFPEPLGDAQNRGRAADDKYWGLTDSNFVWNVQPLGRIPDLNGDDLQVLVKTGPTTYSPQPSNYMDLSGWYGPQPAINPNTGLPMDLYNGPVSSYLYPGLLIDDGAGLINVLPADTTVLVPPANPTSGVAFGGVPYDSGGGSGWETLPGGVFQGGAPDPNPLNGAYHRALALGRPILSALPVATGTSTSQSYFYGSATVTNVSTLNPTVLNNLFIWFPIVPTNPNNTRVLQFTRYAVRVILPDVAAGEGRIDDARYLVHYHFQLPSGVILTRDKICTVDQTTDTSAGTKYLVDPNTGQICYFPFCCQSGYPTLGDRDFIALDNTTTDDITAGNIFVVADGLSLEQRVAAIQSQATLTPAGPGRKIDTLNTPGYQPPAGPNYYVGFTPQQLAGTATDKPAKHKMTDLEVTGTGLSANGAATTPTGLIWPNDSFAFANTDPRDPDYTAGYLLGQYDSNNPSVLYQGPEEMVRAKILPDAYGLQGAGGNYGYSGTVPADTTSANYQNYINEAAVPPLSYPVGVGLAPYVPVVPLPPPAGPPSYQDPVTGVQVVDSGGTRVQQNPLYQADPFGQLIQAVAANNFEIYRANAAVAPQYDLTQSPAAGADARPEPIYSQTQVIVGRSVYVPDPTDMTDGTRSIEVGEILCLDWQTGAVIWRFPDRTDLPDVEAELNASGVTTSFPHGFPAPNGTTIVAESGLRNAFIGFQQATVNGNSVNQAIYQIPGIAAYDLNGDGIIEDNEVFIAPQGQNASGGIYSAVTVAARIPVQGTVQVPVYNVDQSIPAANNDLSPIVGVAPAPAGRYSAIGSGAAVPVTVAFVASQNGVVYAIDAHGNNDNFYREGNSLQGSTIFDPKQLGNSHPGTTNTLWTFDPTSVPRQVGNISNAVYESLQVYDRRLKGEIPATAGFAGSAAVITYEKDDQDSPGVQPEGLPISGANNVGTDEPRLFIGNQNGDLYAMDATALSGGAAGVLPFQKGIQPDASLANDTTNSLAHNTDLKWWFETEAQSALGGGPINATPAVSLNRLSADGVNPAPATSTNFIEKGVYITSSAGRVYCVDWTGPLRKDETDADGEHVTIHNWDGTAGDTGTGTNDPDPPNTQNGAATFNDNYRFHNQASADLGATPDLTSGTIRPRWVYPIQYNDVAGNGLGNINNAYPSPVDPSAVLVSQAPLNPILGGASLMDFVWTKPGSSTPVVQHYVVVAANDPTTDATPNSGWLYLLDQAGDRREFLTNPQSTNAGAGGILLGVHDRYSSPLDALALKTVGVGNATPAWTYRFQYGTYDSNGNLIVQGANDGLNGGSPLSGNAAQSINNPTPQALLVEGAINTVPESTPENLPGDILAAQPSRRVVPTVFFGSNAGSMWAVDLDVATGLFERWRANTASQPVPLPLEEGTNGTGGALQVMPVVPVGQESPTYLLPWQNPNLNTQLNNVGDLTFQPIIARTVPLPGDDSSVDGSIVITGGPMQTRDSTSNLPAANQPPTTIPTGYPQTIPGNANGANTFYHPTNDPPALEPPGVGRDNTAANFAQRFDPTGRYVDQEIDDSLATTRGTHYMQQLLTSTTPSLVAPPPTYDVSYQFPVLFVSTAGPSDGIGNPVTAGEVHELSTNLDGEDTSSLVNGSEPGQTGNVFETSNLGWAFSTDTSDFNNQGQHVYQLGIFGPGGSGTGIAVLTPGYFPSMDPAFPYGTSKTTGAGGNDNGDPTAANFPYYPVGEPNLAPGPFPAGGHGGVFRPRSLAGGISFISPGPIPDKYSGNSGFPLDGNGLFFNKQYAGRNVLNNDPSQPYDPEYWRWSATSINPTPAGSAQIAVGADQTNAMGQIALPAYSGTAADDPNFVGSATLNNAMADGLRPGYERGLINNDDINPTGENAIWIYTGGPDGTLYAYTPGLPRNLGGTGGSGLDGGTPLTPNPSIPNYGAPKFMIVPASFAAAPPQRRPDRAIDSLVAHNLKPFYEWGESVYVVVYDLTVTNAASGNFVATPVLTAAPFPGTTGAGTLPNPASLNASVSGGLTPTFTYPISAGDLVGQDPALIQEAMNANIQFGYVIYKIDLSLLASQQTPGVPYVIQLAATPSNVYVGSNGNRYIAAPVSGGANDSEINQTLTEPFIIANPLAVAGFVRDTQGAVATLNVNTSNFTVSSVGPFAQGTTPALADTGYKANVAASTADGTPDSIAKNYNQALSNGNTIIRYDMTPYTITGGTIVANPNVGQQLKSNGLNTGTSEPQWYIPVITGAGYTLNGAASTSTNLATFLKVVNRSALANGLPQVRAQVLGDLIWRTWPGGVETNVDATDSLTPVATDGSPLKPGGANARLTPLATYGASSGTYAMRPDGVINPLPWEQRVPEVKPWKLTSPGGALGVGGNTSQDYPNIPAQSNTNGLSQAVTADFSGGTDLTKGPGTLPVPSTTGNLSGLSGYGTPNDAASLTVGIAVPAYQPANLVAMQSLTSTYLGANTLTDPLGSAPSAGNPVQLPYTGVAQSTQTEHQLIVASAANQPPGVTLPASDPAGANTIAPFGYTTIVRIYVDSEKHGHYEAGDAYRDVEVWMGVPVDMRMASVESPVEVGSANGLTMGFGEQDGLLGYEPNGGQFAQGLLPTPLYDTTLFGGAAFTQSAQAVGNNNVVTPFSPFFHNFVIQNQGNVNFWNLRAGQRADTNESDPTGSTYSYYQLRSTSVDGVQGIDAAGMDPSAALGNVMPQIVTSLDLNLDKAWNTYWQNVTFAQSTITSGGTSVNSDLPEAWQNYYQYFGGKHTFHKARPGSPTPTTLGIPDIPSAQPLTDQQAVPNVSVPVVSVAVPIGTPSGTYTAPNNFDIFEDHDTLSFNPVPIMSGGVIAPAGPLYDGSDIFHPGANHIVTQNGGNANVGEGVLRVQTPTPPNSAIPGSYLPSTDPGIQLQVLVSEGALTGQIADIAPTGGTAAPSVTNGLNPFVDTQPLVDVRQSQENVNGQTTTVDAPHPAAAISPAAFRSADGSLHVFFARNSNATSASGTTAAGLPFHLFESDLEWNNSVGEWVAQSPGTPASANYDNGASPVNGQWFTTPTQIAVTSEATGTSDTSPFVLQPGDPPSTATLFFLNTVAPAGGQPVRTIYYSTLTSGTNGPALTVGTPVSWLTNPDPSLQRYAPRAAYDPNSGTTFLFYYAGIGGKWSLYYSPRGAASGGVPNDTAPDGSKQQVEFPLSLPVSITTATDPIPIVRQVEIPNATTGALTLTTVVDVYYSATTRTDAAPNVYMTRYVLNTTAGAGQSTRLVPTALTPRIQQPLGAMAGSVSLFGSQDIAWARDASTATAIANLPQVFIDGKQVTDIATVAPVTNLPNTSTNWKYDDASNLLVQKGINNGNLVYVYADTAAGTIRFRGPGAPVTGDVVTATYVPQTYRITNGGVVNAGIFGFFDDTELPTSTAVNAQVQQTSSPTNYILTRTAIMEAGRTWLFWRRSGEGSVPSSLQYTTRRVGIDLKTIPVVNGGMSPTQVNGVVESIALGADSAPGNGIQSPEISSVTVNGNNIPYEADIVNGRIFVAPELEGQQITVTYTDSIPSATNKNQVTYVTRTATAYLAPIEDDPNQPTLSPNGVAVPVVQSVNEGQPYAFLDLFGADPTGNATISPSAVSAFQANRPSAGPVAQFDPQLQPGRVWMFWTSPRARSGQLLNSNGQYPFLDPSTGNPIKANGYDIYWQTLAPRFDADSYASQ
jgi:hypothetical protein